MSSTARKTRPSPSSAPATAPDPTPSPSPIETAIPLPSTPSTPTSKPKLPFLSNLGREMTPGEHDRFQKTVALLTAIPPENMARAAAPLLNDFGVQQALAWSSCSSAREFGMIVRGHAFTLNNDTLTLKPQFRRILISLVLNSPPARTPDVTASLLLKIVAASLFMRCCDSAVRL